jgi:hypothetical protein
VVKYLPRKLKAMSANLSTAKKRKRRRKNKEKEKMIF